MDKTFRAVTFRIQVATYLTKLSLNNRKKSIWLNWNDISLRKIIDFTYLCTTVCSNFDKFLAMFVLFHKRKLPIVEEFPAFSCFGVFSLRMVILSIMRGYRIWAQVSIVYVEFQSWVKTQCSEVWRSSGFWQPSNIVHRPGLHTAAEVAGEDGVLDPGQLEEAAALGGEVAREGGDGGGAGLGSGLAPTHHHRGQHEPDTEDVMWNCRYK